VLRVTVVMKVRIIYFSCARMVKGAICIIIWLKNTID